MVQQACEEPDFIHRDGIKSVRFYFIISHCIFVIYSVFILKVSLNKVSLKPQPLMLMTNFHPTLIVAYNLCIASRFRHI